MSSQPTALDDALNCFVCGPNNRHGLGVTFSLDGEVCRGRFTAEDHHCGFDGITHGGIIFSLLDDVMANCLYLRGLRCFTGKADIRFRQPLPTGQEVVLEGRILKQKRKLAVIESCAKRADNNEIVAECTATFMIETEPSP